ncbi:MAG: hypothetical protein IT237_04200 [Bacteroidia bacterium]|nr:hypothetical protein [Bacteroidia bacterium]
MKKLMIILGIMVLLGIKLNAQSPVTDTLQWLKTNIEQRKNLFINKPLSVLLDSLKELKQGIVEYTGPDWYAIGNLNDTIWTTRINLYFEEMTGSAKEEMHHNVFYSNNFKDTLNTHIKILRIKFTQPVIFLRKWWSYNSDTLGSNEWLPKVAALNKNAIVKDVKVYEY